MIQIIIYAEKKYMRCKNCIEHTQEKENHHL